MHAFIIDSGHVYDRTPGAAWDDAVAKELKPAYKSSQAMRPDLWQTELSLEKGEPFEHGIHIINEGVRLGKLAESRRGAYIAVAHQGGSFVVASAMKVRGFQPKLAVFADFPMRDYDRRIPIQHMLRGLEVPTLFVNRPDPTGDQAAAFYDLTADLGMADVQLIESIKGTHPAQLGRIVTGYMSAETIAA